MFGLVDPSFPVNWAAPLNQGRKMWHICLPGMPRGKVWRDLCRKHPGTLTNMDPPTDVIGPRGRPGGFGAVDLDGSNDIVSMYGFGATPAELIPGTQDFSIAAWVKTTDNTGAIWGCREAGAFNEDGYSMDSGNTGQFTASLQDGSGNHRNGHFGVSIADGNWHHLLVCFDRDNEILGYCDGKERTFTSTVSTGAISTIGSVDMNLTRTQYGGHGGGNWLVGQIDDLSLWMNRIFSPAEAYALYQASKTGYRRELNWLTTPLWAEEQAAGGTTYTFASSDSIAYSDSLAVLTSSFRAASDSIGITDDAVRACEVFRTSEDNVALSDTVDRACENLRSVEDNVACSDTVERVVEYFRAVADSIGITDDVLREISGIREIAVADSLALSEAYLQVVSYFRDLAESLAFTDDFQRQVDYYRQVSDSIAILDSLITALNGIVITPPAEEEETEILDVEEDLYAYLLGCHIVTDLIGTRLYPVEAPQEATRPFIVYEILTRDRDDTQAGENGLVRVGIQFDCQAATYTAVREIEEALRGRFYRFFHRYMGTTFVQSAEISDATDEDSPPVFADAQGIYHSRVDLELWYEEPVPA